METSTFQVLRQKMQKVLKPSRYEHTLGVAYTAATLAMKYDANIENALLAGVLHDCAKCLPESEQREIISNSEYEISDSEDRIPALLHAKAGAILARDKYGISNQEIINSILHHTTGRENMSTLEKIIFIADYIEPTRKNIPSLLEARKLAYEDLDNAVAFICGSILKYLESTNSDVDDQTLKTYQYYSSIE